jgi:ribosome modulation factor
MLRLTLVLALFLPASASAKFVLFQTPSHNIGCLYSSSPVYLRCDIRSGLKPPPPKPKGCTVDWTGGYQMGATGRSHTLCAGDTVISSNARVLRDGTTWRGGPFTCKSTTSGLRCRNRSGHGFFLSRQHSYRF